MHLRATTHALAAEGYTTCGARVPPRARRARRRAARTCASRCASLPVELRGRHDGRVVVVGHSAGGHLALWAASAAPAAGLVGTVALAPVADLAAADRERVGGDAVEAFLGGPASTRTDLDPTRLVSAAHAGRRSCTAIEDTHRPAGLAEAYVAAHPSATLQTVPGRRALRPHRPPVGRVEPRAERDRRGRGPGLTAYAAPERPPGDPARRGLSGRPRQPRRLHPCFAATDGSTTTSCPARRARRTPAASSASGPPARRSPSSPTSASTRCSTAARSRPASPSATAPTSSSTRTWAWSRRSSTRPRSRACTATSRSATRATRPPAPSVWENAQPTFRATATGHVALGHNGNLTNTHELARRVRERAEANGELPARHRPGIVVERHRPAHRAARLAPRPLARGRGDE